LRPAAALPPRDPSSQGQGSPLARYAELSLLLRAAGDLESLFEVVGTVLTEQFDVRACRLYLTDPASGGLAAWDAERGEEGEPSPATPGGALAAVLAREEALFCSLPHTAVPSPEPELEAGKGCFLAALPLGTGGWLGGVLCIVLEPIGEWTPADRLLVGFLADALSLGIERRDAARTHASLRQQIQRVAAQAAEQEALLGQMLSVVAHEMRTPLTAIKAYTEALLEGSDEAWEARIPFLQIINEESDRLGRLLANALDYSRLESGLRSLDLSTLAVADLLNEVRLTLSPEAAKRQVRLELETDPNLPLVEGDSDLLRQLCLNLTTNAIKFSPQGEEILLRVSAHGEMWRLEVRDHGQGIPEDQHERIFERFYRVDTAGTRSVPGTGLGLAIVRGIAELHGGRIWVGANGERGTVFTVELPKVQRAPAAARELTDGLWERPEVKRFLEEAAAIIAEVLEAGIISIMGVHPQAGDLRVEASIGLEPRARRRRVGFRGGVAGKALADGTPVLVNDIESDPRFGRPNHPQYFTKSLLCVPILLAGRPVGVVNVNNKSSRLPFDEEDLAFLTRLVERMAAALERLRAFPGLPSAVEQGLTSMRAVNRQHRELVLGRRSGADYAFALALRLGATGTAALKLARLAEPETAPDDRLFALLKPGDPLEPGLRVLESAQVHALPARAAADGGLGDTRQILLGAEEWWDGSGYPSGLSGEAIPLGSRILAVVRALKTWTAVRPGRSTQSPPGALAELRRQSGSRFDPRVVEELAAVLAEEGESEVAS
jgi:signal transduction histidine kinase